MCIPCAFHAGGHARVAAVVGGQQAPANHPLSKIALADRSLEAPVGASTEPECWAKVFDGIVNYAQLHRHLRHRLRHPKPQSGPHHVVMHGPGGQGSAEASVLINCPLAAAQQVEPRRGLLARVTSAVAAVVMGEEGKDVVEVEAHFVCSLISLQQHMDVLVRRLLQMPNDVE
jgi:hypothetical protein